LGKGIGGRSERGNLGRDLERSKMLDKRGEIGNFSLPGGRKLKRECSSILRRNSSSRGKEKVSGRGVQVKRFLLKRDIICSESTKVKLEKKKRGILKGGPKIKGDEKMTPETGRGVDRGLVKGQIAPQKGQSWGKGKRHVLNAPHAKKAGVFPLNSW